MLRRIGIGRLRPKDRSSYRDSYRAEREPIRAFSKQVHRFPRCRHTLNQMALVEPLDPFGRAGQRAVYTRSGRAGVANREAIRGVDAGFVRRSAIGAPMGKAPTIAMRRTSPRDVFLEVADIVAFAS